MREKGAGMRDQTLKEEFERRQLFWERNRDSVTVGRLRKQPTFRDTTVSFPAK